MSQNSWNAFDRPLQLELQPSRALGAGGLLLYGLLAVTWMWIPLSWPVLMLLAILLAGHVLHLYRVHVCGAARHSIRALEWDRAKGWRLRMRSGAWRETELRLPVFVSYRLVAVKFRRGRYRSFPLLVTADRLGKEDFRRLRVRLIQSAHGDRD